MTIDNDTFVQTIARLSVDNNTEALEVMRDDDETFCSDQQIILTACHAICSLNEKIPRPKTGKQLDDQ